MKPVNSQLAALGTTIFTVMSALAAEHDAINLGQGVFRLENRMRRRGAPVLEVGQEERRLGVQRLACVERFQFARRLRIPTAELNRWLADTDLGRSSAPAAQAPEVLYLTQASTDPPTFVLFTRGARRIHFSFERFLQNRLRERFDFTGTPIRFITRTRAQKPRRARAG